MSPHWEKFRTFAVQTSTHRVRVPLSLSFYSSVETKLRFPSTCCAAQILHSNECIHCLQPAANSEYKFGYYLTGADKEELRRAGAAWLDASKRTSSLEAELVADKLANNVAAWVRQSRRELQFHRTVRAVERRGGLTDKT